MADVSHHIHVRAHWLWLEEIVWLVGDAAFEFFGEGLLVRLDGFFKILHDELEVWEALGE